MNIEDYAKKHPKSSNAVVREKTIEYLSTLPKGSSILDVGCAEGSTIQYLQRIFGDHFIYTGIDLSETRINKAKDKNIPNSHFIVSNAETIPFEENSFDCVLSSQVLEHVNNPDSMIKEISRVLKDSGYFQVDTVFKKRWAKYFYRSPIGFALDPTHLREYTNVNDLKELFEPHLMIDSIEKKACVRDLSKILPIKKSLKVKIPGYYIIFLLGRTK